MESTLATRLPTTPSNGSAINKKVSPKENWAQTSSQSRSAHKAPDSNQGQGLELVSSTTRPREASNEAPVVLTGLAAILIARATITKASITCRCQPIMLEKVHRDSWQTMVQNLIFRSSNPSKSKTNKTTLITEREQYGDFYLIILVKNIIT